MGRMRGSPGMRITLGVLSVLFVALAAVAIWRQGRAPWVAFQREYQRRYAVAAAAAAEREAKAGDKADAARWKARAKAMLQARPALRQIYVPELGVADHCTSCHAGIDDPLFANAPEPYRRHPGKILEQHELERIGCTICHGGVGLGTTVEAAHGKEPGGKPLVPRRYVQASCAHCHEQVQGLAGAERLARGEIVFVERGCAGCHRTGDAAKLPRFGPSLRGVGTKIADHRWLVAWLRNPRRMRPHTAMPSYKLSDAEVRDIVAALLAQPPVALGRAPDLSGASAKRGEELFSRRGCRGCHSTRREEPGLSPRVPDLADIGDKVSTAWLDKWLRDPRGWSRESPMPRLELTDAERLDLVAYLSGLHDPEAEPGPDDARLLRGGSPARGRKLIERYECFGCHDIAGFEKAKLSVPDLAEFAARPVEDLDFGRVTDIPHTKWDWLVRKLDNPRAFETKKVKLRMPKIPLTAGEKDALVTYCLSLDRTKPPPPRYLVRATPASRALLAGGRMVARLHCRGCHRLDGRDARIAHYLPRRSLVPPSLDNEGARVQPQWLFSFLKKPKTLRPWLEIRMPQFHFSDAQAETLVDYFNARSGVSGHYMTIARESVPAKRIEEGASIFRVNKCIQCHPASLEHGLPAGVDPEDVAINLALAKKRLRPEWVRKFLRDPKQAVGGETRMPYVFYDADGVPKVSRADERIAAVTDFLMTVEDLEAAMKVKPRPEETIDWTKFNY